MDIQRKAFESAMQELSGGQTKNDVNLVTGEYQYGVMQVMWSVWQKAQAVPEWISVKNAMPKAGSQVLTYDDYGFVSVENIDGCEDPNNVYFSHWLPLPPVEQEPVNDQGRS